jgi:hypothetical protein
MCFVRTAFAVMMARGVKWIFPLFADNIPIGGTLSI